VTITSLACSLSLLGSPWPVDVSIHGSGNHRHPVPGETQVLRWTVRNEGTVRLDDVRLRVRVPADWSTPVERRLGSLPAGAARTVTLRFTVPSQPRLGPFHIVARTWYGKRIGPSAGFWITVVRHR
jgi:uncharacterized membrane protein